MYKLDHHPRPEKLDNSNINKRNKVIWSKINQRNTRSKDLKTKKKKQGLSGCVFKAMRAIPYIVHTLVDLKTNKDQTNTDI